MEGGKRDAGRRVPAEALGGAGGGEGGRWRL